ncbi:dihydroorotase [Marinilabilia salmonicolor]|jgi:dihydroorotase|uniref:dihydroorotase n=1 Tax=Marinilabilia salmonicolor TaxID=989 RepID=UPI000D49B1FF|nr:dihydroorotase [Marinilabilia salmonicolor]PRZ02331.1 dihydroorotase [Marinilabilia salmonicolor]
MKTLIKNATIINQGNSFEGSVLINDRLIEKIFRKGDLLPEADKTIDAEGCYLIPGVIDDQVHFREPGLTHKADIYTESGAAVAGGVTSFMEMPNTNPQTTTIEALKKKFRIGEERSVANYSFYMGATNDNLKEVLKADPATVCGVKVFMGSSTGNMLVDKKEALENIFREVPMLIATHCEDETTIKNNTKIFKEKYGEEMPFRYHPQIRSAEACYKSSSMAVELASKFNTRLHILHLSTAQEMSLFTNALPLREKRITAEVCVHHLWFSDEDYDKFGSRIKWNPAVKSTQDREALREALRNNILDVVATDHAPHTAEEKNNSYFQAPSGGPLVQHSLQAMFELSTQGIFTKEMVVEKMCHAPAELFGVEKRGYIKEGYFADLVIIDPGKKEKVEDSSVQYKCGWSPFSGTTFSHRITHTFVNGHQAYSNGKINRNQNGMMLTFKR